MYELFPGNYRWSYTALTALAAGGEFGDLSLILPRLQANAGDDDAWHREWSWLAGRLEARADASLADGSPQSASEHFMLASVYHTIGERFIAPANPARRVAYSKVLETFEKGRDLSRRRIERVMVPYEGSAIPAYFIASEAPGPQPTVIFLCGLDTTKELSALRVRGHLSERGLNCLAIDTPGVGEALREGRLFTRHDYEVPVGAAIDYLARRADVDRDRIGIIGSSLGGYYVARAAAFEPRLAAAVAWGAIYDYHGVWHRRLTSGGAVAAPGFQLMFITGTDSMPAALEAIKDFKVQPFGHRIQCPFLVVQGAEDQQVLLDDARKMFAAIGSTDKVLKIFNGEDGGAAHCQFDNHLPAMLYVADWLASKLRRARME